MTAARIAAGNAVAAWLERVATWAEERARRLKRCRTCGRNLFYGEGCAGQYLNGCKPGAL